MVIDEYHYSDITHISSTISERMCTMAGTGVRSRVAVVMSSVSCIVVVMGRTCYGSSSYLAKGMLVDA